VALGCFAAFIVASEALIRFFVEPADEAFQIWARNYITRTQGAIAVGDSTTARGFYGDPDFLNLGYPGLTFDAALEIIRGYERRQPLTRVVVGLSYFNLERNPVLGGPNPELFRSLAGDGARSAVLAFTPRHRPFLRRYWHKALRGEKFVANGTRSQFGLLYDLGPSTRADADRLRLDDAAIRIAAVLPRDPPRSRGGSALIELLRHLHDRGVQTCAVFFPVHAVAREQLDAGLIGPLMKFYEATAVQFGVRFVNLSESPLDGSDGNFADAFHLTPAGAAGLYPEVLHRCGFAPNGAGKE